MSWYHVEENQFVLQERSRRLPVASWSSTCGPQQPSLCTRSKTNSVVCAFFSFDIECMAEGTKLPVPSKDPVIQISNVIQNSLDNKPSNMNVFTLKKTANIPDAQVFSFRENRTCCWPGASIFGWLTLTSSQGTTYLRLRLQLPHSAS